MTDPTHNQPEKNSTEEEQSWLFKIVVLPKYLGEAIFSLIGKSEATETSKFILGYMLVAGLALVIIGILSPETLKAFFAYFFN